MVRVEAVAGGMDADVMAEVAGLEAACVAHEGVRLKLEWPVLANRPAGEVNEWICRESGRVVGFCGLYSFQRKEFELCGMVAPGHRRRGVATGLFTAALEQARSRLPAADRLLTVVDRAGAGGAFAVAVGCRYHNSEYSMRLTERPDGPTGLTMRPATFDDAAFVGRCLASAFGLDDWTMPDPARRPITLFLDGDEPVAVIHVSRDRDAGRVYGFAVPPELRGRGYGGRALRLIAAALLDEGHPAVELEVATDNEHALTLYRRCGFHLLSTLDYYVLPLP
jgi:ribosomal protein S18 acetylase RimI-like enzyme